MSRFLQIFCTILSAILISLAIPNEFLKYGSPLIGIFALYPFYLAIRRCRGYGEAFGLCFLHGSLAHVLSSFWLGNFPGFAIFTLGASDLGTGFFEGFFALGYYFPILYATKSARLEFASAKRHFEIPLRIFWFASLYTIWEYCKSTGFLAYPWGTISMTAYEWLLITQIADITGVYGVTFLFALFSACFGEGTILLGELSNTPQGKEIFASYKQACITALVLFSVTILYGSYRILEPRNPSKKMNTVLVQQNSNPKRETEEENILLAQRLTQKGLDEFSKNGEKCDLVVWSEAVLLKRFPTAELFYSFFPAEEPLINFIRKTDTPFLIGGPLIFNDEKHEYGNSALLFDKNGIFTGAYTKMHLVPFAELIPLRQYEPVRKLIKSMIGFSYGWTPGKRPVLFEIPLSKPSEQEQGLKVFSLSNYRREQATAFLSAPICFDDSAHEVCHAFYLCGSEVFANLTNDSWSKTKSAEIQHFVVAHYRSIEYRTTTIRSANAGYTCVIDPTGKVLADLPLFEEGALAYSVPIYERIMTIYARYGDWLPYSLIFLTFAYIYFAVNCKRKEEESLKKITTIRVSHSLEWYELWDSVRENYEAIFAIDWNNWNI
jgi:apolipoprotein N-acyltransferase